ncbi:MAG TPA: Sua5/YciO/YrdC/YwlC family protein [Gemmataceae bacterium]|jgi:protein-tyrosine phosphatase
MPEVLDWQRVADPHAVIHYAVQALRQGRTIAFPTETGYALTASGLAPEAVRQLRTDEGGDPLTLAVRGPAEARDWAPGMGSLAQRLTRRLWPGPVTLLVGGAVEQGLISRLAEEVRAHLCVNGTLRLTTPGHEALREVLRHLPGPLVFAPLSGEGSAALERMDVIVEDGPGRHAQQSTVVAVNGDAWQVVQPGVVSAEHIRQLTACLIVFICTGNTCRSPLAEALCKKRLADRLGCAIEELPAQGFHVLSAGVAATTGAPAATEAEAVARGYGADLSRHRSQPLTAELAARADYLLGMTHGHLHALADYFAQLGVAPRLLDPAGDIADPIGCEQPVYDECGQQIWRHLEAFIAEITRNAECRMQNAE